MVKHYLILIGFITICIGNMHAMEQTPQRFTPSYRQYLISPWKRLQTWWQQPTQYELQLMKQQENLRNNIEHIQFIIETEQEKNSNLTDAWNLCKNGSCFKAKEFLEKESRMKLINKPCPGISRQSALYNLNKLNKLIQKSDTTLINLYKQKENALEQYNQFLQQEKQYEPVPLYD